MKKFALTVLALLLSASGAHAAKGKLILNLYGSVLDLPANAFTEQNSQYKAFVEGKASLLVWRNLYLWASHGYMPVRDGWNGWSSKAVFTQDIAFERTLGKRLLAAGCGYLIGFLEPQQLAVKGEVGVCSVANAIDTRVSWMASGQSLRREESRQSALGLRLNLAVDYGLFRGVFAELSAGYTLASEKRDEARIKLGGFQLAAGLGIVL